MTLHKRIAARLFAPVDAASLAVFRIAFGAVMLWECWRYHDHGWIARYYITPSFHFTYYGFGWVKPWPGDGMYWHFAALAVLSLCIMLGAFYRASAVLFFLGFTYVFLLDQTRYLNHFYLVSLISFLLMFVPAHAVWSIDALRSRRPDRGTIPAWSLWLMRSQIGIAYCFGGVAKLNADWLRGEPIRGWLMARTDFPLIGPLFSEEWMAFVFAYGGLFIDLSVPWFVFFRRTRVLGLASALSFNLLNAKLFQIGIFPWFMIGATTLFLPPSWPRLGRRPQSAHADGRAKADARTKTDARAKGGARDKRGARAKTRTGAAHAPGGLRPLTNGQRITVAALSAYVTIQILVPLRHLLYPGDVSWTEEGHNFSWHMKLRDKSTAARFEATDPAQGTKWEIDTSEYLTPRQYRKMISRPDLILQFCHHVAGELERGGRPDVEVRAQVKASLNGRAPQWLIDPKVDLAAVPRTMGRRDWIEPLVQPLPPTGSRIYEGELARAQETSE